MILCFHSTRENLVFQDQLAETDCQASEVCLARLVLWAHLEKTATKASQESPAKKDSKAPKVTLDLRVRPATLDFEESWALSVHLAREDHPVTLVDEEAKARMDLKVQAVLQDLLATRVFQAQQVSKEKRVILALKVQSAQLAHQEMPDHLVLKVFKACLEPLVQKVLKDPREKPAILVLPGHLDRMEFMYRKV